MSTKLKPIPDFKSEKAEREFWQKVDTTDYVDFSNFKHAQFPNLKLTTKPVTIRLRQTLIDRLKNRAQQLDLPYQTLIKQILMREMSAS